MGIEPRAAHQSDFPVEINGYAMEAYYGGRVEGRWPNEELPVSYLDVLSMYPTVFVLQGLWWWVVADRLQPYECADDVRRYVDQITVDEPMNPPTWLFMPKLALVQPQDDILPVRAEYAADGDLQIGLNRLTAEAAAGTRWPMSSSRSCGLVERRRSARDWHRGRRAAAWPAADEDPWRHAHRPTPSRLFRRGYQSARGAQSRHEAQLRARQGAVQVPEDHRQRDRIRHLRGVQRRALANDEWIDVFTGGHFEAQSPVFEKEGRFCFPFIAAAITGAARLILTLVELQAAELGASYAMCDTDSMAVIDADGCIGDRLAATFESLNPYDFEGSILKIEDENYDATGKRVPLYAFVKASKRYCLYNLDPKSGRPIIRKALEHGLGHLLPPKGETRQSWIERFWYYMVCHAKGIASRRPRWFDEIALAQLGISTPSLIHPFHTSRVEQLPNGAWPFNFMLVGYAKEPAGATGWCRKHRVDSVDVGMYRRASSGLIAR